MVMSHNQQMSKELKLDQITLSVNLVNQIMGYLGTRPYQEVFQLINGLTEEAKAQAQPTEVQPAQE
jgi:hypothetical protein